MKKNWNNQEVEILESKGGTIALANPFDNLISTNVKPWPLSEIIQKLHRSRHENAFTEKEKENLKNGYYSDLQSINSEDAITWNVFGTVAHSSGIVRNQYISDLLITIGCKRQNILNSEIALWRRIPHPDTLVSGGPEIDFTIFTEKTLILGEAKWNSSIGALQGKNKDKTQIDLRIEFLQKYAPILYPTTEELIVLVVGLKDDLVKNNSYGEVKCLGTTWEAVCGIASHPNYEEIIRYFKWKIN